ncbi:MAG: DUF2213 domain-containing protein [Oscillospiraceae bacterium]|nr:DUF2213 domain-containing protein [Oscillospiraceae bacterium]
MFYKIENSLQLRHKDENGYLTVEKSPILKSGILEYFGSELLPEGANTVDGVKVDPDKIYKVFIPVEELEKGKDSFKMLPITDDHTWLGKEGEDPKEYQVGQTGEGVYVEDGLLYVPLKFTGKEIVSEVENHDKEELSASYYNRFVKSDNPAYDFVAKDIKGNHLALVDKGRCGSDVRVLNSKGENKMAAKSKSANKAVLELDGKRIDLDRFFSEEESEKEDGVDVHEDSISENEDKREIIREIMAVAGKANEDFEGGEDEKVREIAKLAEKLAYNPSEDSETDNAKTCNEDKRELIDEIGGILKDKLDEELWRTVMEKAQKLAYEPSEDSKSDNEDPEEKKEEKEEDKDESKSMNYDALYTRISNSFKAEAEKAEKAKVKAYNAARSVVGDFNPFGMSEKDLYVKALNHLSVALDGKETVAELAAMLKACSAVRSKVDNSFTYGVIGKDEREFNI